MSFSLAYRGGTHNHCALLPRLPAHAVTAPLDIVFAGTPLFAARALDAILVSRHPVIGVLTQPDRPAGRE